jgi:hypothetical protein
MKPVGTSEDRRLGFQEGDWNLIVGVERTTRTRHGGNGRPDLAGMSKRKEAVGTNDSVAEEQDTASLTISTISGEEQQEETQEVVDDEEEESVPAKKPPHSRVLLEVEHIEKAFDELGCPQCGGSIKLNLRTVCIASSLGFECLNEACGYLYHAVSPAATTIHVERNDNFERSTDYAINVLYVLGFIAVGDGCTLRLQGSLVYLDCPMTPQWKDAPLLK